MEDDAGSVVLRPRVDAWAGLAAQYRRADEEMLLSSNHDTGAEQDTTGEQIPEEIGGGVMRVSDLKILDLQIMHPDDDEPPPAA